MVWLILAMLVLVVLAAVVMMLVAVPARRQGRQMLTPRGEGVVSNISRRSDQVTTAARQRAGSVRTRARDTKTDSGAPTEREAS